MRASRHTVKYKSLTALSVLWVVSSSSMHDLAGDTSAHHLITQHLLPSGRRYRSLYTKTTRHRNSFFPLAVTLMNSWQIIIFFIILYIIFIYFILNCCVILRVGYREPVPIWNRFQYNRYLPGPKCNADFGASFRCLSQLKTVARQIPRGTCKTAPAPNVNFVLCRSRSLVFS